MADYVIDTNVLCCASAADAASPFDDADHIPEPDRLLVLDWLGAFHADPSRTLVIDEGWEIYEEYRNKLTDQDYGLLVIRDKLASALFVPIEHDSDGYGVVPDDLAALDASDRKLAAAAVAAAVYGEHGGSVIANATDTDWLDVEAALRGHRVTVEQILAAWCRAKYEAKKKRKGK